MVSWKKRDAEFECPDCGATLKGPFVPGVTVKCSCGKVELTLQPKPGYPNPGNPDCTVVKVAVRAAATLQDRIAKLSEDERKVVEFIVERLEMGRGLYGALHLKSDTRDFTIERAEELADVLVYSACLELKRRMK